MHGLGRGLLPCKRRITGRKSISLPEAGQNTFLIKALQPNLRASNRGFLTSFQGAE
jgi:hypothetical protein